MESPVRNPTVSVVIPTYQRSDLVCQAIDSVLGQTYRDFEIIIVIDGSTDDTVVRLATYGEKITVIEQPNLGVAVARNTGIRLAHGRYLAFLDDDDIWMPAKLERQISILEARSDIGLVFADLLIVNESGKPLSIPGQAPLTPPLLSEITLFFNNYVPMPTVVVRRDCLELVGGFDQSVVPCEDYDLWLRISAHYRLWRVHERLASYRLSRGMVSLDREKVLLGVLGVKEKALERSPAIQRLPVRYLDRYFYDLYLELARFYMENRRVEDAHAVMKRHQLAREDTLASASLLAEIEQALA